MLKVYGNKLKRKTQYKFFQHPVDIFKVNSARQNIIGNANKTGTLFLPSIPQAFYSSVIKMFVFYLGTHVIMNKKVK